MTTVARVVLAVAALLAVASPANAGETSPSQADIEKAVAAIADYDLGKPRRPLFGVEQLLRKIGGQAELTRHLEQQFLKVLESNASAECQVFILQQLWIIGSDTSVPTLQKLLLDEKASHMACYALGRSPSPAVGKALRNALPAARGLALLNVITALADRRDMESLEAIAKLAASEDAQAADAAVAALGRISGEQAAKVLAEARKMGTATARLAATLAYLQCAEGLAAQGKKEEAAAIYEELFKPGETKLIRRGALVGTLALGGDRALNWLIAVLRAGDAELRAAAIAQVPTLEADEVGESLARELPKLALADQGLLLSAMVERGDAAAKDAVAAALGSPDSGVRVAALRAAGRVGDATFVPLLAILPAAARTDAEKAAAQVSLGQLRGEGVDAAILKCLKDAVQDRRLELTQVPLIQALHDRNVVAAVPALIEEAAGPDASVRAAAFKALARLAAPEQLPAILKLLAGLQDDASRQEAERAVVAVARKIPDEGGRADAAIAALQEANAPPARLSLLRVLGGIANAKALEAIRGALKDGDAGGQDAAVRTLANWPDAAATSVLLEVFRSTSHETHRVLALRGCVRLLNQAGSRPVQETVKLYGEAMSFARRPDDRKLVLAGVAEVPAPEALKMAMDCLGDDAVKAEATLAALRVARAISATHRDEAKAAMARLAASTTDAEVRKQAESVVAQADKLEDYIVAWQVAGPYAEEGKDYKQLFDVVFPPEKPDAKEVAWRRLPAGTDPAKPMILDLKAAIGGEERCAYVRTWVFSEKERPARLELGCDDGNKVWLNSQFVYSKNLGGKAIPGSEKADVALKQGWNSLLIKITQATGPWEFCARFRTRDGARLEGIRVDCMRRE